MSGVAHPSIAPRLKKAEIHLFFISGSSRPSLGELYLNCNIFRRIRKIAKSDVNMEQIGLHLADFDKI
jgi:hypothetical protein